MPSLSKLVVHPAAELDDHAIVLTNGAVFRFTLSNPDYTLGTPRSEMAGFSRHSWIPVAAGFDPRAAEAKEFEIVVPPGPYNYKTFKDKLERALPFAREFHRPDGRYLRLHAAQLVERTQVGSTYRALFKPSGGTYRYPIVDDPSNADKSSLFHTVESSSEVPILAFNTQSRLRAGLAYLGRAPSGVMFVGVKSEQTGLYSIASLGVAVGATGQPTAGSAGIFYDNGTYKAYVGTTVISISQHDIGGFGTLKTFALAWTENGTFEVYVQSAAGFLKRSVALGVVDPFVVKHMTLGTRADLVGAEGYFMPGAPGLGPIGLPFFSLYRQSHPMIQKGLGEWYTYINRFPAFTEPPQPPGLGLTIEAIPDILVGKTNILSVQVERRGGVVDPVLIEAASDDPSIRVGDFLETDAEDATDRHEALVTVEEGAEVGPHTITVKVASTLDSTLSAQATVSFGVLSAAAALAEGAIAFNPTADWVNYNFTELAKDALLATSTKTWRLAGLAKWTSRGDGIFTGGENIVGWGPSYAHIPSLLDMALDHTNALVFQGPSFYSTGALLFGMASQANKGHYWYVYKAADGLKIRTSLTTTEDSAQSLPAGSGPQHLAVTVDRAAGRITLYDTQTGANVTAAAPAWVGSGRLCVGALRQSDGTILAVSRVICLGHVAHQSVPTPLQLERQAEHMRGFILRTDPYRRPEYPGKVIAIVEANKGEPRRNRHPRTAGTGDFMQLKGTATASGGSLHTDGTDEAIWRAPFVDGTDASKAQDVVIVANEVTRAGAGRVGFGVGAYDNLNMFCHVSTDGNTGTSRKMRLRTFNPGIAATQVDDTNATPIPITGAHAYAIRLQPAQSRVQLLHIASGATIDTPLSNGFGWTGRVNVMLGGAYRGLDGLELRNEKSHIGIEFEAPSETLGFVMTAEPLTSGELNAVATNLSNSYDYSTAIPDSGTAPTEPTSPTEPTPTPAPSTSTDISPLTVSSYNADQLYGTTGEMANYAKRWDTFANLPDSNKGGTTRIHQMLNQPLDSKFTKAEWEANPSKFEGKGAYRLYRSGGKVVTMMCWAARGFKDPRAVAYMARVCKRFLDQVDWRGSPRDKRKASWISTSLTDYLGIVEGPVREGQFTDIYGTRFQFEAGIMAGHYMHAAYVLWMNRHLDPSYATLSHQLRGYVKLHLWPDWDQYYKRIGDFYAAGSTTVRKYPERVRRGFIHADMAEWTGANYLALLETDMFKAGVTAPITVTLTGYDLEDWNTTNTTRSYGGPMKLRSRTQSLELAPGTSADVATHPDRQAAIDGFNNWRATASLQLITAANFKSSAMASAYPDGAYSWTQGNLGSGQGGLTFAQTLTYLSQTTSLLASLYIDGVMTAALGSQSAADLFIRRIVGGFSGAVFPPELRPNKQAAADIISTGANSSGTAISRAYVANSWSRITFTRTAPLSAVNVMTDNMLTLSFLDATRRLGTIAKEYDTGSTSNPTLSISKILELVTRSGRLK